MELSNNNTTRPSSYYQHNTNTINTSIHNTASNSSELFICFSSSSMKISKSILSPGRSRDQHQQPMSLSTSLSRRLRTNGSLKGGQASPIFSARGGGGKKRGCGFENPEPSSPKVTCIGQVRVKSKKKGKQNRSLSRRRSAGNVSSRRVVEKGSLDNEQQDYTRVNSGSHQRFLNQNQQDCLPHRNQRWVHLPLTICEALRAFGAEFSCLLPCSSSSCFGTERGKEEKREENGGGGNGQSSCGALFARWLVAMQDGEGGKEREIELVVGEDEDDGETRSSRRHVLEDFKIESEVFDGKGRVEEEEEEEGRVSICIPPKNALLLMRCKSDPMKMAALSKNRFWEPPPPQEEDDEEEEEQLEVKEIEVEVQKCEAPEEVLMAVESENQEPVEVDEVLDLPMEAQHEVEEKQEDMKQEEELNLSELLYKEEDLTFMEALEEQIKNTEDEDTNQIEEKEEGCRISSVSFSSAINQVEEDEETEHVQTVEEEPTAPEAETESTSEKDQEPELEHQTELKMETENQEMETTELKTEQETETETEDPYQRQDQYMVVEENNETVLSSLVSSSPKSSSKPPVLPDCLLLMMYEPKLSMEVSKETWVCSRDFSRWLPQRHKHVKHPKIEDTSEDKKRTSTDSRISQPKKSPSPHQAKAAAVAAAPPLAPPRSSCSYPVAAVTMAAMIEQKLGYEPFLTRCKSEPMRTAGKLAAAQEGCFWTKRKLEPLRRAAFHVGAAGVGF